MRPFFPFYGSKWRAAPLYPAPVGKRLVEPFCGSAGYSLAHAERQVHLYDLDPVIVAIWEFLIRSPERDILELPDLGEKQLVADLPICQEAKWLIGFWINKACAYPCHRWGAWARDPKNRKGANYWGFAVRHRIAKQLGGIRHWTVQCLDYRDIPLTGATWFVDPPYQGRKGSTYRKSSKKIDYDHLGQWCRNLPGTVIACEQEGADWLSFQKLATIKATRGTSTEVAWIRNPLQPSLFPQKGDNQ